MIARFLHGKGVRIGITAATLVAVCYGLTLGAAAQGTLERVKRDKKAVVAIANDPPYMKLEADGTPTGTGPEIDLAVLEQIGVEKLEAQVAEYGAMIPAVQANRVDFVSAGGLFIKPERCQSVLFSEPVFCGGEAFIVGRALAGKVDSYKGLAEQGLKVGVCGGCTEHKYAVNAGVKPENIVVWPDSTSGMKMLGDGRIDVMAHDATSATNLQKLIGDKAGMVFVNVTDIPVGCSGAVFNKKDTDLRDAYNTGLQKIIDSGKYREILTKYGFEKMAELRGTHSTAEFCRPQ